MFRGSPFHIVHNGNLVNCRVLRAELQKRGIWDVEGSDTRLVAELLSSSSGYDFEDALQETLHLLEGAFCFLILYQGKIYAVRDKFGFHPLQLAKFPHGWMVASESCVFPFDVEWIREINPGELVILNPDGFESRFWTESPGLKFDIFEYIYFLSPLSQVYGVRAELARERMGYYLALEHPREVEMVIPVHSSGTAIARGYYAQLKNMGFKVRWRDNILVRRGEGRTFILPRQEERINKISKKFSVISEYLRGIRKVALIDDSIVRGNTSKAIIALLKESAKKVNDIPGYELQVEFLSGAPPYISPDIYGIDTYRKKEEILLARLNYDIERAKEEIGADYLGYGRLDKVIQAVLDLAPSGSPLSENSFYTGPFTGEYPAGIGDLEL